MLLRGAGLCFPVLMKIVDLPCDAHRRRRLGDMPIGNGVGLVDLPEDVFEVLFKYLYLKDILHLERCCQRLKRVTWLYWRQLEHLELVPFLKTNGPFDITCCQRLDTAAAGLLQRCGAGLKSLDISKFGPLEYGLRAGMEHALIEHCSDLLSISINNRLLDRDWLLKYARASGDRMRHVSMWMVDARLRR